ncbi:MAG: cell division protein FtsA [Bacillota bacterium]|nr:cell division protein FtsA [Bacillota bacterium]
MDKYTVGVDIGTSKICAAVGKVDRNGDLQIVGITTEPSSGVKKGVVVDIDSTAESIRNCIHQLEKIINIKITEVNLAMPSYNTEIIWNKGVVAVLSENKEVTNDDVERVIKAAKAISISIDKQIIGFEVEQFILDGHQDVIEPIGMFGSKLEVEGQVVVSPASIFNNLVKSVDKAGYKIKNVILQPSALSDLIIGREESSIYTSIVDVGADTIDIFVYKGSKICFTEVVPLGGNIITNDISQCLKLPFTIAERLKVKYGNIKNDKTEVSENIKVNLDYNDTVYVNQNELNEVIKARVEELIEIIGQKLVDSGYFENISKIVLVGGGLSFFDGINELGRKAYNKIFRIGTPQYVGTSSPVYSLTIGLLSYSASMDGEAETLVEETSNNENYNAKVSDDGRKENENFVTRLKNFFIEFF